MPPAGDTGDSERRHEVLSRVIESLGRERFEKASSYFKTRVVDPMVSWTVSDLPRDDSLENVPHEITPYFDVEPMPSDWERVNLLMELLEVLPAYWLHCEMGFYLRDLEEGQRVAVWRRYRKWLSEEAWTRACAAAYALHVELFEESKWTGQVWEALVSDAPSDLLVHRVVANSAAVPWQLKAPLYRELLKDPRHHGAMAIAMHGCLFNAYGKRDDTEFQRMVDRIHVAAGTREGVILNEVTWRLQAGKSNS